MIYIAKSWVLRGGFGDGAAQTTVTTYHMQSDHSPFFDRVDSDGA